MKIITSHKKEQERQSLFDVIAEESTLKKAFTKVRRLDNKISIFK